MDERKVLRRETRQETIRVKALHDQPQTRSKASKSSKASKKRMNVYRNRRQAEKVNESDQSKIYDSGPPARPSENPLVAQTLLNP